MSTPDKSSIRAPEGYRRLAMKLHYAANFGFFGMCLAGMPTAIVLGGTSESTTALAAIVLPLPIVKVPDLQSILAPVEMLT